MNETGRSPGLECPHCSYLIPLTIPVLLSGRSIYCTACGLELEPDAEASKSALQLLADLRNQLDTLETTRIPGVKHL